MILNCQYNPADNSIACDYPYIQTYVADNGQNYYVSTLWNGADLMTNFLLIIIILIAIGKILFDFFFTPVVKIKRKYD